MAELNYLIHLEWTGNLGEGTKDYRSYHRSYTVNAEGKEAVQGSADPQFKGDASKWNPEEMLLSSLSACHMLWYLHLCSTHKITVSAYTDQPLANLNVDGAGNGQFTKAILRPHIVIQESEKVETARALHHEAHQKCFVARSINFPVSIEPTININ